MQGEEDKETRGQGNGQKTSISLSPLLQPPLLPAQIAYATVCCVKRTSSIQSEFI
jgi:hypothetical protein